jgi:hypothetical protein
MDGNNVIGAFSEEQASRISGVSIYQLRHWDSEGFFPAAFGVGKLHVPYHSEFSTIFGTLRKFRSAICATCRKN